MFSLITRKSKYSNFIIALSVALFVSVYIFLLFFDLNSELGSLDMGRYIWFLKGEQPAWGIPFFFVVIKFIFEMSFLPNTYIGILNFIKLLRLFSIFTITLFWMLLVIREIKKNIYWILFFLMTNIYVISMLFIRIRLSFSTSFFVMGFFLATMDIEKKNYKRIGNITGIILIGLSGLFHEYTLLLCVFLFVAFIIFKASKTFNSQTLCIFLLHVELLILFFFLSIFWIIPVRHKFPEFVSILGLGWISVSYRPVFFEIFWVSMGTSLCIGIIDYFKYSKHKIPAELQILRFLVLINIFPVAFLSIPLLSFTYPTGLFIYFSICLCFLKIFKISKNKLEFQLYDYLLILVIALGGMFARLQQYLRLVIIPSFFISLETQNTILNLKSIIDYVGINHPTLTEQQLQILAIILLVRLIKKFNIDRNSTYKFRFSSIVPQFSYELDKNIVKILFIGLIISGISFGLYSSEFLMTGKRTFDINNPLYRDQALFDNHSIHVSEVIKEYGTSHAEKKPLVFANDDRVGIRLGILLERIVPHPMLGKRWNSTLIWNSTGACNFSRLKAIYEMNGPLFISIIRQSMNYPNSFVFQYLANPNIQIMYKDTIGSLFFYEESNREFLGARSNPLNAANVSSSLYHIWTVKQSDLLSFGWYIPLKKILILKELDIASLTMPYLGYSSNQTC